DRPFYPTVLIVIASYYVLFAAMRALFTRCSWFPRRNSPTPHCVRARRRGGRSSDAARRDWRRLPLGGGYRRVWFCRFFRCTTWCDVHSWIGETITEATSESFASSK